MEKILISEESNEEYIESYTNTPRKNHRYPKVIGTVQYINK